MKNKKTYYLSGVLLCLFAVGFLVYALTHPELSFPWPNRVSYFIYFLYAVYTVLIFCMPRFEGANLASCVIIAVQLTALALLAISVVLRKTSGNANWYLPVALLLTCLANFASLYVIKRGKPDKKE